MADNIIACRVCGKIMSRVARDICPECFKEEEALFQKVKNFLKENPGAHMEDVAKFASCSIEQIDALIRSGRLERAGIRRIAHPCQLCQEIIYDGVLCTNCKKSLKEQVSMLKFAASANNKNSK